MRSALPLSSTTRELVRELPDLVQEFAATGELPERARQAPEWERAVAVAAAYVHAYREGGPAARLPAAERQPLQRAARYLRREFAHLLLEHAWAHLKLALEDRYWLPGAPQVRSLDELGSRARALGVLAELTGPGSESVVALELERQRVRSDRERLLLFSQDYADAALRLVPDSDGARYQALLPRHYLETIDADVWASYGRSTASTDALARAIVGEAQCRVLRGQVRPAGELLHSALALLAGHPGVAYNALLCAALAGNERSALTAAACLAERMSDADEGLRGLRNQIQTDGPYWSKTPDSTIVKRIAGWLGTPVGEWIMEAVEQ